MDKLVFPIIGIVSYLPEDKKIREIRKQKIISLLKQCHFLFNVPVAIVAQNWSKEDTNEIIDSFSGDLKIKKFDNKLGIVGARRELREWFLKELTHYNYLIMLDDDIELQGTIAGANQYLNEIMSHPNMYGVFKLRSLILFATSREMLSKLDYPDNMNPEKGEGFEDIYYVSAMEKLYPDRAFYFSHSDNFKQISEAVNDVYSTWWHGQYNKHEMGDKMRARLKEL